MKLKPAQSVHIRDRFEKMQGTGNFLELLNDVKRFKFGEKAKPFTSRQINRYVFAEENVPYKKYTRFEIKKKSGKSRAIHAPVKGLKMIQTCLNIILQEVYQAHPAATGFVPGKSIVDNARVHANQPFVYNIDLKDFFPSIDQARVWARLQHPPFNLAKGTSRQKIANVIAGLCCHTLDATQRIADETDVYTILDKNGGPETCHVLPQGAPTSPTITNIICERLDRKLTGLAKRFQLRYSRYADDITFSSQHFVYAKDGGFSLELQRIIKEQNFRVNDTKTRLQKPGYRQEVTGLVVNEQPNVPTRYVKQVRRWLYLWETYGIEKAQAYFLKDYLDVKKGRARSEDPNIGNVICGKLLYLKMVKGAHNPMYLKLQARLDTLLLDGGAIPVMNGKKTNTKEKIRLTVIALAELEEIEERIKAKTAAKINPVEAALGIITKRLEEGLADAMALYRSSKTNET